ncbi:MAG: acylphosphatase [Planctomycetales bacterium]|nr:acylphosphatase [Planctomycetales bacterium]
MSPSPTIRCEVHYSGRVQGVGFRWNACSIARGFQVTGFVRNLPDGRVQLVAEGERGEVKRLLAEIADSMSGNIQQAELVERPATGEFTAFEPAR